MPNSSKNDNKSLVIKVIGKLADADAELLDQSLRCWLGL